MAGEIVNDMGTIDAGGYFRILWRRKWAILGTSLVVAAATLGFLILCPDIYLSSAIIRPETSDKERSSGALGVLATSGLQIGGPSKAEEVEVLLKSDDLTIRVFRRHDPWPFVLLDEYDPATRQRRAGAIDTITRREQRRALGDWDAIRAARERMRVSLDKRTGTLKISFESRSAEGAARMVGYYLEEAKGRIQEEAFERARRNKEFLQSQISKTLDPMTRERLYTLYGQEVEREMLARNREQFGFTVVDSPKVPDRKFRPQRSKISALAGIVGFFASWTFFSVRRSAKSPESLKAQAI